MIRIALLLAAFSALASRLLAQCPGEEPDRFEDAAPKLFACWPFFKRVMTEPANAEERAWQRCLIEVGALPGISLHYSIGSALGPHRRLIVFTRNLIVMPGGDTQVIAITDGNDALLAWKEISEDGAYYATASLVQNPRRPILELVCDRGFAISGRAFKVYSYSLRGDRIKLVAVH